MNPPRLTPTPAASAPVTSFGMISTERENSVGISNSTGEGAALRF
jgi:hypothetical protein